VPGSNVAVQQKRREAPRGPQRASPQEVRAIVDKALASSLGIEMIYHSLKDDSRKQLLVLPEKVALNREGAAVLVALDVETGNRLSYALAQIERARTTEKRLGEGA
jgi:predicted DNA-binding transcriptional regulator YafY